MDLSGLLKLVHEVPEYRALLHGLRQGQGRRRAVLEGARPYLLACLYADLGLPVLVLVGSHQQAKRLHEELQAWCPSGAPIMAFPEPDVLPYEQLTPDLTIVRQRLRVLFALSGLGKATTTPPLVVASAHAMAQKTVSARDFTAACHVLSQGMHLDLEAAMIRWLAMGYRVEVGVELPGTLSRRGGIVDIFSPQADLPARIELLGDEIESIRLFDPATQRSVRMVSSVVVVPAWESRPLEGRDEAQKVVETLRLLGSAAQASQKMAEDIRRLIAGESFDGAEFYFPLFNQGCLSEYLPQDSPVVLHEPSQIEAELGELDAEAEQLRQARLERGELPPGFPRPYFTWAELEEKLQRLKTSLSLGAWGEEEGLGFTSAAIYGGRLRQALDDIEAMLRDKQRVVIVSQQGSRLSELLQERDVFASPLSGVGAVPAAGSLSLVQGSLGEGWVLALGGGDGVGAGKLTLLTDAEVFGFSKQRRIVPKRAVRREDFLSDLTVGDYVVHIDHGIARFQGMARMSLDGVEREYLTLEYAAGDRLYVPADQVDRVGPYIGPGGYEPALSRLGTQEWARAKQRVKEAAGNIARELLETYAAREVIPGTAFPPDTVWQQELEASFPYLETPDQLQAVREVKQDMEKAKPMDRLLLGDVGYGKTEVAVRAAFKAVMEGMQVAVLVPTTVLAQQHLATFTERMGAFPVRIEVLSRFRSDKEQRQVIEGLKDGTVDICIGTHRLLQKDVSFRRLGLVIMDEEQRFGVAHKERLKQMRKEVDVLTLSATPIPRTLHMSLAGVRDMSTMETPPEERLPIKTYLSEYSEGLIREAILRELERGGQVFFVHNRVQSIAWVASRLREIVPEARFAVAHGQMPEEVLERVMLDFADGKSDVLVCTTIIESGLDMPNVNTIIVNEADKLGLAQLYQLRGRVGRGANRAYGYFLYSKGKRLTEAAQKRLKTIFEATELGAGFRIAMKDLEIRGAGNLLGVEQSGHIGAVGFDLYSRLLAETVEEVKARAAPTAATARPSSPAPSVTVDLPLPAHLPEEYVSDLSTRLVLYQRMAKIASVEGVEALAEELRDRFGEVPGPARNLLYIMRVKALALEADVEAVSVEEDSLVIRVREGARLDRAGLERRFAPAIRVGSTQVRLDMKHLGQRWQEVLGRLLEELAK